MTGRTRSSDFPTTTNAIQPGHGGGTWDAFVTRIIEPHPAITVTKTANVSSAEVGETITYTYRVTNAGKVNLTGIVAHDDRLGAVTLGSTSLPPGAGTSGTLTHTVVEGDLPGITNTVAVTGTPPSGPDVTAGTSASVSVKCYLYLPFILAEASATPMLEKTAAPAATAFVLPIGLLAIGGGGLVMIRRPRR